MGWAERIDIEGYHPSFQEKKRNLITLTKIYLQQKLVVVTKINLFNIFMGYLKEKAEQGEKRVTPCSASPLGGLWLVYCLCLRINRGMLRSMK